MLVIKLLCTKVLFLIFIQLLVLNIKSVDMKQNIIRVSKQTSKNYSPTISAVLIECPGSKQQRSCEKKVMVNVRVGSSMDLENDDKYLILDEVYDSTRKARAKIMSPYIIEISRGEPVQMFPLEFTRSLNCKECAQGKCNNQKEATMAHAVNPSTLSTADNSNDGNIQNKQNERQQKSTNEDFDSLEYITKNHFNNRETEKQSNTLNNEENDDKELPLNENQQDSDIVGLFKNIQEEKLPEDKKINGENDQLSKIEKKLEHLVHHLETPIQVLTPLQILDTNQLLQPMQIKIPELNRPQPQSNQDKTSMEWLKQWGNSKPQPEDEKQTQKQQQQQQSKISDKNKIQQLLQQKFPNIDNLQPQKSSLQAENINQQNNNQTRMQIHNFRQSAAPETTGQNSLPSQQHRDSSQSLEEQQQQHDKVGQQNTFKETNHDSPETDDQQTPKIIQLETVVIRPIGSIPIPQQRHTNQLNQNNNDDDARFYKHIDQDRNVDDADVDDDKNLDDGLENESNFQNSDDERLEAKVLDSKAATRDDEPEDIDEILFRELEKDEQNLNQNQNFQQILHPNKIAKKSTSPKKSHKAAESRYRQKGYRNAIKTPSNSVQFQNKRSVELDGDQEFDVEDIPKVQRKRNFKQYDQQQHSNPHKLQSSSMRGASFSKNNKMQQEILKEDGDDDYDPEFNDDSFLQNDQFENNTPGFKKIQKQSRNSALKKRKYSNRHHENFNHQQNKHFHSHTNPNNFKRKIHNIQSNQQQPQLQQRHFQKSINSKLHKKESPTSYDSANFDEDNDADGSSQLTNSRFHELNPGYENTETFDQSRFVLKNPLTGKGGPTTIDGINYKPSHLGARKSTNSKDDKIHIYSGPVFKSYSKIGKVSPVHVECSNDFEKNPSENTADMDDGNCNKHSPYKNKINKADSNSCGCVNGNTGNQDDGNNYDSYSRNNPSMEDRNNYDSYSRNTANKDDGNIFDSYSRNSPSMEDRNNYDSPSRNTANKDDGNNFYSYSRNTANKDHGNNYDSPSRNTANKDDGNNFDSPSRNTANKDHGNNYDSYSRNNPSMEDTNNYDTPSMNIPSMEDRNNYDSSSRNSENVDERKNYNDLPRNNANNYKNAANIDDTNNFSSFPKNSANKDDHNYNSPSGNTPNKDDSYNYNSVSRNTAQMDDSNNYYNPKMAEITNNNADDNNYQSEQATNDFSGNDMISASGMAPIDSNKNSESGSRYGDNSNWKDEPLNHQQQSNSVYNQNQNQNKNQNQNQNDEETIVLKCKNGVCEEMGTRNHNKLNNIFKVNSAGVTVNAADPFKFDAYTYLNPSANPYRNTFSQTLAYATDVLKAPVSGSLDTNSQLNSNSISGTQNKQFASNSLLKNDIPNVENSNRREENHGINNNYFSPASSLQFSKDSPIKANFNSKSYFTKPNYIDHSNSLKKFSSSSSSSSGSNNNDKSLLSAAEAEAAGVQNNIYDDNTKYDDDNYDVDDSPIEDEMLNSNGNTKRITRTNNQYYSNPPFNKDHVRRKRSASTSTDDKKSTSKADAKKDQKADKKLKNLKNDVKYTSEFKKFLSKILKQKLEEMEPVSTEQDGDRSNEQEKAIKPKIKKLNWLPDPKKELVLDENYPLLEDKIKEQFHIDNPNLDLLHKDDADDDILDLINPDDAKREEAIKKFANKLLKSYKTAAGTNIDSFKDSHVVDIIEAAPKTQISTSNNEANSKLINKRSFMLYDDLKMRDTNNDYDEFDSPERANFANYNNLVELPCKNCGCPNSRNPTNSLNRDARYCDSCARKLLPVSKTSTSNHQNNADDNDERSGHYEPQQTTCNQCGRQYNKGSGGCQCSLNWLNEKKLMDTTMNDLKSFERSLQEDQDASPKRSISDIWYSVYNMSAPLQFLTTRVRIFQKRESSLWRIVPSVTLTSLSGIYANEDLSIMYSSHADIIQPNKPLSLMKNHQLLVPKNLNQNHPKIDGNDLIAINTQQLQANQQLMTSTSANNNNHGQQQQQQQELMESAICEATMELNNAHKKRRKCNFHSKKSKNSNGIHSVSDFGYFPTDINILEKCKNDPNHLCLNMLDDQVPAYSVKIQIPFRDNLVLAAPTNVRARIINIITDATVWGILQITINIINIGYLSCEFTISINNSQVVSPGVATTVKRIISPHISETVSFLLPLLENKPKKVSAEVIVQNYVGRTVATRNMLIQPQERCFCISTCQCHCFPNLASSIEFAVCKTLSKPELHAAGFLSALNPDQSGSEADSKNNGRDPMRNGDKTTKSKIRLILSIVKWVILLAIFLGLIKAICGLCNTPINKWRYDYVQPNHRYDISTKWRRFFINVVLVLVYPFIYCCNCFSPTEEADLLAGSSKWECSLLQTDMGDPNDDDYCDNNEFPGGGNRRKRKSGGGIDGSFYFNSDDDGNAINNFKNGATRRYYNQFTEDDEDETDNYDDDDDDDEETILCQRIEKYSEQNDDPTDDVKPAIPEKYRSTAGSNDDNGGRGGRVQNFTFDSTTNDDDEIDTRDELNSIAKNDFLIKIMHVEHSSEEQNDTDARSQEAIQLIKSFKKSKIVYRTLQRSVGDAIVTNGQLYSIRGYFVPAIGQGYQFFSPVPLRQHFLICADTNTLQRIVPPILLNSKEFTKNYPNRIAVLDSGDLSVSPSPHAPCINVLAQDISMYTVGTASSSQIYSHHQRKSTIENEQYMERYCGGSGGSSSNDQKYKLP